jgi:hypothetical protein
MAIVNRINADGSASSAGTPKVVHKILKVTIVEAAPPATTPPATTIPAATTATTILKATSVPQASRQTERSEALAVNALLVESGMDRTRLRAGVSALNSCTDVEGHAQTMTSVAASRRNLLERAESLSFAKLPDGATLKRALLKALTSSVEADGDLAAWADDLARLGCTPGNTTNDPNYQAATAPDNAAESQKMQFAQMWDPVATQFYLPAQTADSF